VLLPVGRRSPVALGFQKDVEGAMADLEEKKRRLHIELSEVFAVLNSCLRSYYEGETHMYRPMAGQLRILLCDSSPLFSRVFPDLRIEAVREIEWTKGRRQNNIPICIHCGRAQ
jgi:hypothetical protein